METKQTKSIIVIIIGLITILSNDAKAQWNTTGNNLSGGEYLGANGSSIAPLNLKTLVAQPINFYTNSSSSPYMTILGSTNPGYVGIGTTSPSQLLEVSGGNMNLATATNYYMLGGANILGHKGNVSNIFAGVDAGRNNGNSANFI